MNRLLGLLLLLLALPLAAWAEEEGTFTPTTDSMGLKPIFLAGSHTWHLEEDNHPPFAVAVAPGPSGRDLVIRWALDDSERAARIEVRVNGQLRGTQTWSARSISFSGSYLLEPSLPLEKPFLIELTAWRWMPDYHEGASYRQEKLPPVSLDASALRPPRFSISDATLTPKSDGSGATLKLRLSRPWAQLSINGAPVNNPNRDNYPTVFPGSLKLPASDTLLQFDVPDARSWHYVTVRAWDPYFGGEKETKLLLWPETPTKGLLGVVFGFGPMALLLLTLVLLTRLIARRPMSDSPELGWASWLPLGGWALAKQGRWTLAWVFGLAPLFAGLVVLRAGLFWLPQIPPPITLIELALGTWLLSALLGFALARWLGPVKTPPKPLRTQNGPAEIAQVVGCFGGLLLPGLAQLGQRRGPAAWRFVVLACWLYLASWGPDPLCNFLVGVSLAPLAMVVEAVGALLFVSLLAAVVGSVFEANRAAWRIRDAEVAAQPAPEGGAEDGLNLSC